MKYITLLLLISFLIFSCEEYELENSTSVTEQFETVAEFADASTLDDVAVPPPPPPPLKEVVQKPSAPNTAKGYVNSRKLIKHGKVEMIPTSVDESQKEIFDLVDQYGGYISSQLHNNNHGYNSVNLEVKIPTLQFDDFFAEILTIDGDIQHQNINVNDVTEEFIDVQSRIQTKKEVENRYRELLKRAKNIEEVLKVERELASLRSDIESFEGRLNFLKNKTNYSTLTVELNEKVDFVPSRNGFGEKVVQAFGNGWAFVQFLTLGIISIWPVLFFIPLVYIIIRRFRSLKPKVIE